MPRTAPALVTTLLLMVVASPVTGEAQPERAPGPGIMSSIALGIKDLPRGFKVLEDKPVADMGVAYGRVFEVAGPAVRYGKSRLTLAGGVAAFIDQPLTDEERLSAIRTMRTMGDDIVQLMASGFADIRRLVETRPRRVEPIGGSRVAVGFVMVEDGALSDGVFLISLVDQMMFLTIVAGPPDQVQVEDAVAILKIMEQRAVEHGQVVSRSPVSPPPVSERLIDTTRVYFAGPSDTSAAARGRRRPGIDRNLIEAAVDDPPTRISGPPVHYPEDLRQAGIEGFVTLEFVVDQAGRVEPRSITVLNSTHPGFEPPAIEVVRGSRFSPGRVRGLGVRVLVEQTIAFTIR
jgi:TonB family protein